jgi:hypothetical protein
MGGRRAGPARSCGIAECWRASSSTTQSRTCSLQRDERRVREMLQAHDDVAHLVARCSICGIGRSEREQQLPVGPAAELAPRRTQLDEPTAQHEREMLLERQIARLRRCDGIASVNRLIVRVLALRALVCIGLIDHRPYVQLHILAARALVVRSVAEARERDAEASTFVHGADRCFDVVGWQRSAGCRAAAIDEADGRTCRPRLPPAGSRAHPRFGEKPIREDQWSHSCVSGVCVARARPRQRAATRARRMSHQESAARRAQKQRSKSERLRREDVDFRAQEVEKTPRLENGVTTSSEAEPGCRINGGLERKDLEITANFFPGYSLMSR